MIKSCIDSVLNQTYQNIEYIIMDANSKDATIDIIKQYPQEKIKLISEKDKGSCDALNKGIALATGDVVCFLCADDMYAHKDVIKKVAETFNSDQKIDIVYSDIVYVNKDKIEKVERYWKSSPFKKGMYSKGWLPPHTSLFIKREALKKYGTFNINFKFASDVDLSFRLFEIHQLKSFYIPEVLVKMRSGGVSNSSIKNMYKSLKDCYDVFKSHNIKWPIMYIFRTIIYRANHVIKSYKVKNV